MISRNSVHTATFIYDYEVRNVKIIILYHHYLGPIHIFKEMDD